MNFEKIVNGEISRHIHMISFVLNGQRLECVLSNGELTSATLTTLSNGGHRYLNAEERDSIADLVKERVGESTTVTY